MFGFFSKTDKENKSKNKKITEDDLRELLGIIGPDNLRRFKWKFEKYDSQEFFLAYKEKQGTSLLCEAILSGSYGRKSFAIARYLLNEGFFSIENLTEQEMEKLLHWNIAEIAPFLQEHSSSSNNSSNSSIEISIESSSDESEQGSLLRHRHSHSK